MARMAGPGLLVAVGYMDPGNWATDIAAGSQFGYALLWVVLLASLTAMLLQTLSLRLGLVARQDLARACRDRYGPRVNRALWLMAEVAIVACDVAEVLGSALALHLLFGVSLLAGIAITAFDTVLVLGLQGKGFRQVEAIVLGLIVTISVCFAVELALVGLDWPAMARGFVPDFSRGGAVVRDPQALLLAIGILGATVMPHNLYLHSSIAQTRHITDDDRSRREAIRLSTLDTIVSLSLALLVNAAILALAASAFHATGHSQVTEIQDAYHLLDPLVGGALASVEGFLDLKIPCWQRRLVTRALALVPTFLGVLWLSDAGVGAMLVGSQVVLSLQLPFAIWPLLRLTSDRAVMGRFANGPWLKFSAWGLLALISLANLWLLKTLVA
jgi:manganese transport protein